MLSLQYHIGYWAVAISAVALYQLFILHTGCIMIFRATVGPLAAYTLYASFQWHRYKEKTDLGLLGHQALVAKLLIGLGSVVDFFHLPDENMPKPTVLIHALLAFVTVGVLEPLRQNRSDIEPTTMLVVHFGPRSELLRWSWRSMSTHVAPRVLFLYNQGLEEVLSGQKGGTWRNVLGVSAG